MEIHRQDDGEMRKESQGKIQGFEGQSKVFVLDSTEKQWRAMRICFV